MTGQTLDIEGAATSRRPSVSRFSPALFAVAALCFFLPFGTVSCSGDDEVHVTGIELVSRTVPGAGRQDGEPNLAQEVEDKAFVKAAIALLAPLVALLLSVSRPAAIGRTFLVTLAGIVFLLWLPLTAALELADFRLGPGFVGALAIEVGLAGMYLVLLVRRRLRRRRQTVLDAAVTSPGTPPFR